MRPPPAPASRHTRNSRNRSRNIKTRSPWAFPAFVPTFRLFFARHHLYRGEIYFDGGQRNISHAHIEILILSRNSRNKYYKVASHGRFRVPTRVPTVPTQGHLFRLMPSGPHAQSPPPQPA